MNFILLDQTERIPKQFQGKSERITMSINKSFLDFHLFKDGWCKAVISDEESAQTPPVDALLSLRMIEFSHDDKPDLWYQAEILNVNDRSELAKNCFVQFGLPKPIAVNCIAQKEDLEKKLQKEFAS